MPRKKMAGPLLSLLLLLLLSPLSLADPPSSEAEALLQLKASFVLPKTDPLPSWSSSAKAPPCDQKTPWDNIACNQGVVQALRLNNLGLSGTIDIDALRGLTGLRSISLEENKFSGPMPDFSALPLKSLFISNNKFSGEIPDDFFASLDHLKKLWINGNTFAGPVPSSLFKSTDIMEIHIENNKFSGALPDFVPPALSDLNVSGNALTGPIPEGLAKKFKADSFMGNAGLCGPPLDTHCKADPLPMSPERESGGGSLSPTPPLEEEEEKEPLPPTKDEKKKKGGGGTPVFLVILGVVVIVGLVLGAFAVARNRGGNERKFNKLETDTEAMDAAATVEAIQNLMASGACSAAANAGTPPGGPVHKRSVSSGSNRGSVKKGGGGADLVMVNDEKGTMGMPDLMKAAAEVLGNGGLGSAYKAVMSSGLAVAVKRMRELNRVNKETFDAEMRKYGRLRHKNVLPPLAYMYRREEKLVVSEFISKGSLLYILHGDRGGEHAAMDWPTRLKIIRGVVAGLAYLHAELASLDVPHANLKSGNILLAEDYEPLMIDYGFIGLINPTQVSNLLFAYKSPEFTQHSYVCPKSDVYCLGIIILEILTGKFPSQYLNSTKGGTDVVQWAVTSVKEEKEADLLDPRISNAKESVEDMVKVLRLGVACTDSKPDNRPELKELSEQLKDIARNATTVATPAPAAPTTTVAASPVAASARMVMPPTTNVASPAASASASTTVLQQSSQEVQGAESSNQKADIQTTTESLGPQQDG